MSTFRWCVDGFHDQCHREYEITFFDGRRYVNTGEIKQCECPKRGCKCYVPARERTKKTRKRKK